jgi:hypothetical protein
MLHRRLQGQQHLQLRELEDCAKEQITICHGGRDPREFSANPSARCPSARERRQTPAAKLKDVTNAQG